MKKAFTLIELLVVIIILGIIITLVMPLVTNTISNTRNNTNDTQSKLIIEAAKRYIVDNDIYIENDTYISISLLKSSGYLTYQTIEDLTNKSSIDNKCVKVSILNNNLNYEITNCN